MNIQTMPQPEFIALFGTWLLAITIAALIVHVIICVALKFSTKG